MELIVGIESLAVLAVGVGAAILVPVVYVVSSATQDPQIGECLSESAREMAKDSLVWGLDTFDYIQTIFAEAGESFLDLVADAKTEHTSQKTQAAELRKIEIIPE